MVLPEKRRGKNIAKFYHFLRFVIFNETDETSLLDDDKITKRERDRNENEIVDR